MFEPVHLTAKALPLPDGVDLDMARTFCVDQSFIDLAGLHAKAFAAQMDAEIMEEHLDAIEVRKAMAEKDTVPWEQAKKELGL